MVTQVNNVPTPRYIPRLRPHEVTIRALLPTYRRLSSRNRIVVYYACPDETQTVHEMMRSHEPTLTYHIMSTQDVCLSYVYIELGVIHHRYLHPTVHISNWNTEYTVRTCAHLQWIHLDTYSWPSPLPVCPGPCPGFKDRHSPARYLRNSLYIQTTLVRQIMGILSSRFPYGFCDGLVVVRNPRFRSTLRFLLSRY